MGNNEYKSDSRLKTSIRQRTETDLAKLDKRLKTMTEEEKAEYIKELQRRQAELTAQIAADDPEGVFARIDAEMENPENPLYHTFLHGNERSELPEFEVDFDDETIIDEYKQYVFLEGVPEEEALKLLGVKKVTDQIVVWGDEDEEEMRELNRIMAAYGDKVTDPYTAKEKEQRAKEIADMEARGINWKGGEANYDPSDNEIRKDERILALLDLIGVDDLESDRGDVILNAYENLEPREKQVADMRIARISLRDCGEELGISHEAVRSIESKVAEKLRNAISS